MIINFKYAQQYLNSIGLNVFGTYSDEDAQNFLSPEAAEIWKSFKINYPDLHEILNRGGQLFSICVLHGATIQIVGRKINIRDKRLKDIIYLIVRKEYISPNNFSQRYFETIVNINRKLFSESFLALLENEHDLLFDKMLSIWDDSFVSQSIIYSKAIEKSVLLVDGEQEIIVSSLNKSPQEIQFAKDEAINYVNNILENDIKLS